MSVFLTALRSRSPADRLFSVAFKRPGGLPGYRDRARRNRPHPKEAIKMQVDTSIPYLGSWVSLPEPTSGDDAWPAFNVFNGATDAAQTYAREAARIRADAGYNDYRDPVAKRLAAIQAFAKTVIGGRAARFQDLLNRVAATIATNQRALQTKATNPVDASRSAAIWGFLSAMPGGDRQRAIEHAARIGDREGLAASLSAPEIFGFIPNEQDRGRLADTLLRTTDEAAYNAFVELRAALAIAQGAWMRCQSFILADARLPGIESTGA
jgi:hypothetical protein